MWQSYFCEAAEESRRDSRPQNQEKYKLSARRIKHCPLKFSFWAAIWPGFQSGPSSLPAQSLCSSNDGSSSERPGISSWFLASSPPSSSWPWRNKPADGLLLPVSLPVSQINEYNFFLSFQIFLSICGHYTGFSGLVCIPPFSFPNPGSHAASNVATLTSAS